MSELGGDLVAETTKELCFVDKERYEVDPGLGVLPHSPQPFGCLFKEENGFSTPAKLSGHCGAEGLCDTAQRAGDVVDEVLDLRLAKAEAQRQGLRLLIKIAGSSLESLVNPCLIKRHVSRLAPAVGIFQPLQGDASGQQLIEKNLVLQHDLADEIQGKLAAAELHEIIVGIILGTFANGGRFTQFGKRTADEVLVPGKFRESRKRMIGVHGHTMFPSNHSPAH